jgi:hypothetical protein
MCWRWNLTLTSPILDCSAGVPFGDLVLHDLTTVYTEFNDLTVREFLAEMNFWLGRNDVVPPAGHDAISLLTEDITRAFEGGTPSQFAQDHLRIPGLPGDFNHDDVVDAADYVVWRKGVGVEPTDDNYNLWRANFGQPAAGGGEISSVPEPATCATAIMLLGWLIARRR